MQKINRLGWAEAACISSYGVRIGVRVNTPGRLGDLFPHLPSRSHLIESPRRLDALYSWIVGGERKANLRSFGIMYGDAARIARTLDSKELLDSFATNVRLSVALLAPRLVFIHAGAVAWRNQAIIIPGRTLSGKSTLVEALVRAGAEYLSDEYAVLDSRGYVHSFPEPLGIREAEGSAQTKRTVEEIGGVIARHPMRPGVIVTTHYRQGAKSRFRAVSRGQGVLDLVANAVAAREAPARVLRAAREASTQAIVLRGARGDARFTAERLITLLEANMNSRGGDEGGSIDEGIAGEYGLAT